MSEIADMEARYQAMSREELIDAFLEAKHRISMIIAEVPGQIRRKPLLGGVFGHGAFVLASWWTIKGGLDAVSYFVLDAESGYVIGWGDSKEDALSASRQILQAVPFARLRKEATAHATNVAAYWERNRQEREEARAAHIAAIREKQGDSIRSIPKRRKQIFDASEGKCHYCGTVLTLDGKWHIEHKMPKALMGGNEPGNLVASCVTCNHRKKDKTDVEFKAQLAKEAK